MQGGNIMIIRHNVNASCSSRNLKSTIRKQLASNEKLASGLRINRAGDDAAGLSISEKMRSLIRGLNQGSMNAQDGISLVQTAEGAMEEIHSMLQRMKTLSVQSANGTYSDSDRELIEKEVQQLTKEIDRIADNTEFNGMNLLNGTFASNNSSTNSAGVSPLVIGSNSQVMTFNDAVASIDENSVGLFIENISEYVTTQTTSGSNTTGSYDSKLIEDIEKEIVPNAVKQLLNTYSSLNYLNGSSVGIGLKLYSENSSTLAYVRLGVNGTLSSLNKSYTLAINMAAVNWDNSTKNIINRSDLEATIAHEMTHAFMDEALTSGMLGCDSNFSNVSQFPSWFKEGVAQLASGPGNWVKYGLGLDENSNDSTIKNVLSGLAGNSNAANYGTGYLACAYLGHLASGETGEASASSIAKGIDGILYSMISGSSLDDAINARTNGKYSSISDFTANLKNDAGAYDFVRELINNTGNGLGSIITNDLSDDDVLDDNKIDNVVLFKVNPNAEEVVNNYGGLNVNPISGGSASSSGSKPIDNYTDVVSDPLSPQVASGNTIDLSDIKSIDGITYDQNTKILTINKDGNYIIKGNNTEGISILVNNGTKADITLDNVDLTTNSNPIHLENNAEASLKILGNCSITTTGIMPAINNEDSNLVIEGSGTLTINSAGTKAIDNGSGKTTINSSNLVVKVNNSSGTGSFDNNTTVTNGVIFDGNMGTAYGTVNVNNEIDCNGGIFTVANGSTVNVSSGGKIIGNSNIINNGTINNHGTIGSVSGSGITRNYISGFTKNIVQPVSVDEGNSLSEPSVSTIRVTYNGGQTKDIVGTWQVYDKDNNIVTDYAGTTVKSDDVFTYKLTFNSEDNIFFDSNSMSSYSMVGADGQSIYATAVYNNVSPGGPSISNNGQTLTYTYTVTANGIAAPVPGAGNGSGSTTPQGGIRIQLGGKAEDYMAVNIDGVKSSDLGIDSLSVATHEKASNAISLCDSAINKLSGIRANLGAYQNRLEHAISSIDNNSENTQSAESRIRDTDMAKEMMENIKEQILMQAAQNLLYQSNIQSEGILKLLA